MNNVITTTLVQENTDFVSCLVVKKHLISTVHKELNVLNLKSRSQPNVHSLDYLTPLVSQILTRALELVDSVIDTDNASLIRTDMQACIRKTIEIGMSDEDVQLEKSLLTSTRPHMTLPSKTLTHTLSLPQLGVSSWLPQFVALMADCITTSVVAHEDQQHHQATCNLATVLNQLQTSLPTVVSSFRCVEVGDTADEYLSNHQSEKLMVASPKLSSLIQDSNGCYFKRLPLLLQQDKCSSRHINMIQYANWLLGDHDDDTDLNNSHKPHSNRDISRGVDMCSHNESANMQDLPANTKSNTVHGFNTEPTTIVDDEHEIDVELDGVDLSTIKQQQQQQTWSEKCVGVLKEVVFLPGHGYNPQYKHTSDVAKHMSHSNIHSNSHSNSSSSIDNYSEAMRDESRRQVSQCLSMLTQQQQQCSFSFIELFAGIGGFGQALTSLGGYCSSSCEIEQHARSVYISNHKNNHIKDAQNMTRREILSTVSQQSDYIDSLSLSSQTTATTITPTTPPTLLFSDVTVLDGAYVPKHDILTAGFPCQPFSRLGQQPGLHDEVKGQLILHVLRLAMSSRSKVLFLENVPGLVSLQDGYTLCVILRAISRAGYAVSYEIIDAVHVVPQYRRRIYIVAIRRDLLTTTQNHIFTFPKLPMLHRTVSHILESDAHILPSHILSQRKWNHIIQSQLFVNKKNWKLARLHHPAGTLVTSYRRGYFYNSQFVPVYLDEANNGKTLKSGADLSEADYVNFVIASLRNVDEPAQLDLNISAIPPSLRRGPLESTTDLIRRLACVCVDEVEAFTEQSVLPLPTHVRYFTQRECARLMGFPEHFHFPGLVASSNVVTPAADTDRVRQSKKAKNDSAVAKTSQSSIPVSTADMLESNRAYAMLGNAVCPPVIAAIGTSIIDFIQQHQQQQQQQHQQQQSTAWMPRSSLQAIKLVLASCSDDERTVILQQLQHNQTNIDM